MPPSPGGTRLPRAALADVLDGRLAAGARTRGRGRHRGRASRIGVLYGVNTLGAATGAFATTWMLFPRFGLAGSARFAAGLNLVAAIAALLALLEAVSARRASPWSRSSTSSLASGPGDAALAVRRVGGALRGRRIPGVVAGDRVVPAARRDGEVVGVQLRDAAGDLPRSGWAPGAAVGSAVVSRIRRPARAFLLLQAFVGLYAGASVLWLVSNLPRSPALAHFCAATWPATSRSTRRPRSRPSSLAISPTRTRQFIRLYVLLPLALVGPPTLAMGASFPMLQRVALVDLQTLGRRVATVMAANIAGSTVGAIATGWLALTYFGSAGTLRMLTVPRRRVPRVGGALGRRRQEPSRPFAALAIAGTIVLACAHAGRPAPVGRRPRNHAGADLFGGGRHGCVGHQDRSAASTRRSVVYVNGIGQSWIPYGDIHTVLGALPAFVHPSPRTAAVIGLGSGDTVYAVAGRKELTAITAVEIIGRSSRRSGIFRRTRRIPRCRPARGPAHRARRRRRPRLRDAQPPDVRHHRGGRLAAGERVFRKPVLGGLLPPAQRAAVRGRARGHVGPDAARSRHVRDCVPSRPQLRRHPDRQPRADRLRRRRHPRAAEAPAVHDYFWRAGIDIAALLAPYLDRVHILAPSTAAVTRSERGLVPPGRIRRSLPPAIVTAFEPRITRTTRIGLGLFVQRGRTSAAFTKEQRAGQRVVAWRASCVRAARPRCKRR